MLGGIARELSQGCSGCELELGSCSKVARESLGGVAWRSCPLVEPGGVEPGWLRSCSGVARESLAGVARGSCSGVARDVSQVCLGVDLESLAGELLKAIAAELIQGCTEIARELLGRVAWERCLGVARGSAAGVEPGLLGS